MAKGKKNPNDERAAAPGGDGMPLGNTRTPEILPDQVQVKPAGAARVMADDAAMTIAMRDFETAKAYLDTKSWLAEWQYVDWLYQSPNFDDDWRANGDGTARISRFNILKNTGTMATQVRRGVFSDQNPFVLKPTGKLTQLPDSPDGKSGSEMYIEAITELFHQLDKRGDLEYNMELFIDCMALQGTAIANLGWMEDRVKRTRRKRKASPQEVTMPSGNEKTVHTLASDDFETVTEEMVESYPFFEFRRLGTTFYDPKWCTPNRPEKSAGYKHDVDYVNMSDLQQMSKMDCYKDIPDDKALKKFFYGNQSSGDAPAQSQVAEYMSQEGTSAMHAQNANRDTSADPGETPIMKVRWSTSEKIVEVLRYRGREKCIRNGDSEIGDFALGVSATWVNVENSGYGIGIGRLNAGDQRMDEGVLNEILKMIAYPMNAPLVYNSALGNAPTQNIVMGLATLWGLNAPVDSDMRKVMTYLDPPHIPPEAFEIYKLGKEGGEDLVGANSTTMQGNLGGPGSSAMRTAAGVNRVGSKADENVATPIQHIEYVLTRWYEFLWHMITTKMPVAEIRRMLSDKFGDAIVAMIDADVFFSATFTIDILAGSKLAARAATQQLIPFLNQLLSQPQIMEFNHQKGMTINFKAIEDIFLRMSELQGYDDIFVPMTDEEKQQMQQTSPNVQKAKGDVAVEQAKGVNKQAQIQKEKDLELRNKTAEAALEPAVDIAGRRLQGAEPLEFSEGKIDRQADTDFLGGGGA